MHMRKVIIEVPRWESHMEQEFRFGLDLGRMANFPASKSFDLMKPSYISNEMTQIVAHFYVLRNV